MLIYASLDDYIYILVGLIWLGFSIYKGVQKKKMAADKPVGDENEQPSEKKKSIFDDFLNQILAEEEPVHHHPSDVERADEQELIVVEQEPVVVDNNTESRLFSYDDAYEESNYLDQTSVYQQEPTTKSTIESPQKTLPTKQIKRKRFDLRKAVIYSEILNRPYL